MGSLFQGFVYVTNLASVPNRTSNKVDKSRYRFPQRLALFRKTMIIY